VRSVDLLNSLPKRGIHAVDIQIPSVFDIRVATRLTRPQQVERNRELLLDAARAVFTESGYARATLEAIAERAGFSKGVVYSQFASKADLFFALLERRIAERAEQNRTVTEGLAAEDVAGAFLGIAERDATADPAWQQVLIEFRAQAARDPQLNERYALLHERTLEQLAAMLAGVYQRSEIEPPAAPRTLAEFVLAFGNGLTLERSALPNALPTPDVVAIVSSALGLARRTP
jgi:AcrR family transcriptional regulator